MLVRVTDIVHTSWFHVASSFWLAVNLKHSGCPLCWPWGPNDSHLTAWLYGPYCPMTYSHSLDRLTMSHCHFSCLRPNPGAKASVDYQIVCCFLHRYANCLLRSRINAGGDSRPEEEWILLGGLCCERACRTDVYRWRWPEVSKDA